MITNWEMARVFRSHMMWGPYMIIRQNQGSLSEKTCVPSPEGWRASCPMGRWIPGPGSSHCKHLEVMNSLVRNKLVCTYSHTIRWLLVIWYLHHDKLGHQDQSDKCNSNLAQQSYGTTWNLPTGTYRKMPRELSGGLWHQGVLVWVALSQQTKTHGVPDSLWGEWARAEGKCWQLCLSWGAGGGQRLQGAEAMISICS